jgi:uncharacterized membrane protein
VLVAGSVLLLVGFLTLEIRVLAGKTSALDGDTTALELALQTINWTAATTLLLWRELRDQDSIFKALRLFMTGISIIGLLVNGGLLNNAFIVGIEDLGSWSILNIQLLQYFVPALLFAAKARLAHRANMSISSAVYGGAAMIGLFAWLTLEVRFFFESHSEMINGSQWEIYSYSLVWLLYATALIFSGLKIDLKRLRMAGIALLSVVILKVFLGDLSNLEGIARAASFMGLGIAMIGLGYLYQRLRRVA